jgi:hypothetical protein
MPSSLCIGYRRAFGIRPQAVRIMTLIRITRLASTVTPARQLLLCLSTRSQEDKSEITSLRHFTAYSTLSRSSPFSTKDYKVVLLLFRAKDIRRCAKLGAVDSGRRWYNMQCDELCEDHSEVGEQQPSCSHYPLGHW